MVQRRSLSSINPAAVIIDTYLLSVYDVFLLSYFLNTRIAQLSARTSPLTNCPFVDDRTLSREPGAGQV